MNISVIISQVTVLAILMAVGFIGGKTKVLNDEDNKSMTRLLTKIAMPALTLSAFSVEYDQSIVKKLLIVLVLSFIAHLLSIIIAKIFFIKAEKDKKKVFTFANTFSNAGFMGLPFIYALLGSEALLYGSVYMIVFHILIWTYGENLFKAKGDKLKVEKLLKNPAIVSIVVGIVIFSLNIRLPFVIDEPISLLASITSPLAMIILGERISKIDLKKVLFDKEIYYFSIVKLLVTPLMTLLLLRFINIDFMIKNVIVIMQALPTAVLTVVFANKHNIKPDLASQITVITHLFSMLTIPIVGLFL